MDLGIAGKGAVVTGASSGIGRGIALALGAEGVRLALAARRRNLLEEVAGDIVAKGGVRPLVIECDLMQQEAPAVIAAAALVCFLASPLARYITGTVIPVDGGLRRYQF